MFILLCFISPETHWTFSDKIEMLDVAYLTYISIESYFLLTKLDVIVFIKR